MERTIEEFLINPDTVPDYFAMINIADVTDQLHAFFFGKDAAGVKLGDATYVRVGYNRPNGTGTLMTRGEFSLFFDIYMNDLLTYDQWSELIAANIPDEGIV
jgi:hypothetical protein